MSTSQSVMNFQVVYLDYNNQLTTHNYLYNINNHLERILEIPAGQSQSTHSTAMVLFPSSQSLAEYAGLLSLGCVVEIVM